MLQISTKFQQFAGSTVSEIVTKTGFRKRSFQYGKVGFTIMSLNFGRRCIFST